MLKLPGDEFVSIELVRDAVGERKVGVGEQSGEGSVLHHFVIKVDSMEATLAEPAAHGIEAEAPVSPDGSGDFLTSWLTDPDGNRIELVQWPAGHPDGITGADRTQ